MSIALPGQPTLIRKLNEPTPDMGPKELPRGTNGHIAIRQHDLMNDEDNMRPPQFDVCNIYISYLSFEVPPVIDEIMII